MGIQKDKISHLFVFKRLYTKTTWDSRLAREGSERLHARTRPVACEWPEESWSMMTGLDCLPAWRSLTHSLPSSLPPFPPSLCCSFFVPQMILFYRHPQSCSILPVDGYALTILRCTSCGNDYTPWNNHGSGLFVYIYIYICYPPQMSTFLCSYYNSILITNLILINSILIWTRF